MAKSMRSKWKRKCRAVKRERYGKKELDRLQKTLNNDPASKPGDVDMKEISETVTVVDKSQIKAARPGSKAQPNVIELEANDKKRVFNLKTMRDQHGAYPVWMHPRKTRRKKVAKRAGKGKK